MLSWLAQDQQAQEPPPARNPSPDAGKLLQKVKALRVFLLGVEAEGRFSSSFSSWDGGRCIFPGARCLYLAADLLSCIPKLVLYEPFLHFLHEIGHFWLQPWDGNPVGPGGT